MDKPKKIRVLLADDHAVVRKGIRDFLEEDETLRVIGEANDGEEALALIARQAPDVAVFDIQMPRQARVSRRAGADSNGIRR